MHEERFVIDGRTFDLPIHDVGDIIDREHVTECLTLALEELTDEQLAHIHNMVCFQQIKPVETGFVIESLYDGTELELRSKICG